LSGRLRLHTRAQNSAGERVRIALNLKGITYEYVPVPSLADQAYLRLNPQGLMPALEIDGAVLTQSLAILEYLEERFPDPSILPENPVLRARSRAFAQAVAAEIHALTVNRVRKRVATLAGDEAAGRDWFRHWAGLGLAALEAGLADRDSRFAFADHPTLADIALVPQMRNARRLGLDLGPLPRLVALDARCREVEAVRLAAPEAQADFGG
jgi:maleylacetoacetate isomerase/maleylpyruvate isomerase